MKALIVSFGVLLARPALAGALRDVVSGLREARDDGKDDGRDHQSGGSSDKDSSSSSSSSSASGDGDGDWDAHTPSGAPVQIDWGWASPAPPAAPGMHVHLYLAGQSVVDSNGSLTMEVRGWYEDFGLGVRQTSFFEEAEPKWLRLDLWTLSAHYRAYAGDRSELWLEGGLGGLRTIDELTSYGPEGGLRVEHPLTPALGVSAEGRGFLLQDGVRALELRAAFRAAILYVS